MDRIPYAFSTPEALADFVTQHVEPSDIATIEMGMSKAFRGHRNGTAVMAVALMGYSVSKAAADSTLSAETIAEAIIVLLRRVFAAEDLPDPKLH